MEETNQTFADEEGDETIVSPRFDDEETVLARPVVPLEEVGDAPAAAPSATAARPSTVAPAPLYTRLRGMPRRSLVAALVLVSALAGSVLGVGGLYLYQKQRNAAAEEPAAAQQAETSAPVAQPTTEAEPQNQTTNSKAAEPTASAPATSETNAREEEENADSAKDKDSDKDVDKSVVERRDASEDRESVATPRRGKKGARDEEAQREERRARRDEDQSARDDGDRPEARRVGVITYRPRRANPRRGPYADTDRLRRIFEGQP